MNKTSDIYKGHRARLKDKFLDGVKLSDYELLELLLTYALPRIDTKPIAKDLIKRFGGLRNIIHANKEDLLSVPGIKEHSAVLIKTIDSLMKLSLIEDLKENPIFEKQERLYDYLRMLFFDKKSEEFHVLYLDNRIQLILDDCHTVGTINWATIYPREITKKALNLGATNLILAHNHPSINTSFSKEDIEITIELREALKHQDIELLDHLLVSGTTVYSAKELYLLK